MEICASSAWPTRPTKLTVTMTKLLTLFVSFWQLPFLPGLSISTAGDVVAGRPFTLQCKITRPTGDRSVVTWTRDDGQASYRIYATRECTASIQLSSQSPAGLSGGCQHVNGVEVYTVTIESTTEDTGRGRWRCQYAGRIVSTTLDVQVPSVPGLSISAAGDVVAGRPFTLQCKITRPTGDRSVVTWTRDDGQASYRIYATRECTPSIQISSQSPAGLSGGCQHVNGVEVYTVTIQNVTEDTGRGRWRCQFARRSVSTTLDVQVPSVPGLSISAAGDVVAGRPFTLQCKITRPTGDRSVVTWTRNDGQALYRIYAGRECTASIPVSPSSPAGLSGGCQQVNGEEVYTVTIENATEDTGRGRWRCQYAGRIVSTALDVQVRSVPGLSISAAGDVVAGRPFTLQCKITRPTGDRSVVTWTRDVGQASYRIYATRECTASIPVSPSSPAGLSGGCQHVNEEEVYTVTIRNVTGDTGRGRWICQYGGRCHSVAVFVPDLIY
ncbi:uncharacterized protein LOC135481793 isoform X2 [Liolophura sinensis]|uniref:uncharacterized protein LOC135481793 isoform X2 n=1 Tax=Liolophura sinensis TaxID=3198878 RepID=UPI003159916B